MPAPFCCVACAHGRSSHRRGGTHADRAGAQRIVRGRAARRSRRLCDPLGRRPGARARRLRDRGRHGRLRLPGAAAGHEPRPPRRAARRLAAGGRRHHRQPLLRVESPDDSHGLPRDPGRGGRGVRGGRRGVDLPGQRLPEGRRRAASPADRVGRRDRQRLHPDGDDGGERRGALRRRAGGDGPLRAALARAGRRGSAVRTLRPRDHAVHEGGRHGRLPGRRPAARSRRWRGCRSSTRRSSRAGR